MLDIFERSINMGIGLFSYSKEKIEEIVDELVQKGDISQYDAKAIVSDLIKRGENQREQMRNIIRDEVIKALDTVNIARKEDLISKNELRSIVREEIVNVLKDVKSDKKVDL